MSLTNVGRALKHRSYRLYFSGQVVSLCGTWMQQIAMSWLMYRLTNSALMLSATVFLSNLPIVILGLWSGALADKWNKRKALIALQSLYLIHALTLCVLTTYQLIEGWHLLIFALLLGIINAFDIPLRQAYIASVVTDKDDLPNAIALNSMMVNGARIVGPSIAGIILSVTSESVCFGINAVSYFAIIFALKAIKPDHVKTPSNGKSLTQNFFEGVRIAINDPWISRVLLMLVVMSLFASPYSSLLPMLVKEVYKSGPNIFGTFMAFSGAGAMLAGFILATKSSTKSLGVLISTSVPTGGLALIAFSMSANLYLACISLFIIGFSLMLAAIASNTLIQSRVPDSYRGRVMTLYSMALLGGTPLGGLFMGGIANAVGVTHAVQISAYIVVMLSLCLASSMRALSKQDI